MSSSAFVRARWSVIVATLLTFIAIVRYPGGTLRDPSTPRYSLDQNFLSDLGMTTAHGGQPNRVGAVLFTVSLVLLVVGLGGAVIAFVRLYSESPRQRRFARAAQAVGVLVSASFIGVAFTPEDRLLGLHVKFTLFAFRVFPLASLLMVFASLSSTILPRRMAIGWALLTVVLAGYVIMLGWGPDLSTLRGLMTQVTAQKIVAITSIGVLVYLSTEADRALMAAQRTSA